MPKIKKYDSYSKLAKALRDLPVTWYPALISIMIVESHKKKVWVKGGFQNFVKTTMKEKKLQ